MRMTHKPSPAASATQKTSVLIAPFRRVADLPREAEIQHPIRPTKAKRSNAMLMSCAGRSGYS